jgi:hypothetical protein
MTQEDSFNSRPQRPPNIDPLRPGSNPSSGYSPHRQLEYRRCCRSYPCGTGRRKACSVGQQRRATHGDQFAGTSHRTREKSAAHSEMGAR